MVWGTFVWFLVSLVVSVALAPKPPKPKPATIDDFSLPTAELDRPLPVLFGTKRITGANVLWHGDLLTTKRKQKTLFSSTTIGFKYHIGIHFGLGHGPVDELSKIEVEDKELWSGSVTANDTIIVAEPDLFGGDTKDGGMYGKLTVWMGAPDQTASAYLSSSIGTPMPAFRGMFGVIWERDGEQVFNVGPWSFTAQNGYIGNSPFVKPFAFTATRILKGWENDSPWNPSQATVGNGMNPAHIVYQVLTDKRFGQGSSAAQIDEPSFLAAATTLFNEGLGLNLLWNQSSRVEDFLQIVIDHIGGVLALDPINNKYVLKLFRADYDPMALDTFGVDQIDESGMQSLQTQGWGETVNELNITYTDPDTLKSIPLVVQDLANIRNQGGVVSESIDRSGITDHTMIALVGSRELAARSSPLWRARFAVNREFWDKTIGDVFKLNWPRPNLQGVVMRVMTTNPGALADGKIAVEALQDIYSLTGLNYSVAQAAGAQTAPLPTPTGTEDTNPNVLSVSTTIPPVSPADGDRYFIPATPAATGAWTGQEGTIAEWDADSESWSFIVVPEGVIIYDEDTGVHITTDGAGTGAPFTPSGGGGSSISATGTPSAAAHVARSTNQSIPSATPTVVVWEGQVFDTEDLWPNDVDLSEFVAAHDGYYSVTANVAWDSSTDGDRTLSLQKNAAEIFASSKHPASDGLEQNITGLVRLQVGDTVKAVVTSSAIASVNLVAGGGLPNFTISRQRTLLVPTLMRGATWARAGSVIIPPVNDVIQHFTKPAFIHSITIVGRPGSGSCLVDIWKRPFSTFPPTVADSIVGASSQPEIVSDTKYFDDALSGWDRTILADDVLTFHLTSVSSFEQVFVQLEIRETE